MVTKRTKQVVLAGVIMVAMLVGAAGVFAFSFGKYDKVKPSNGTVTLPVAKLEDGGKEINFFAVKAADGSIRTAFDACDSCYRSKKGYEQQGNKMNCNNCNQKFTIDRLGPSATGGCNPGYLPNQLNGATISIKASDLKDGARYF